MHILIIVLIAIGIISVSFNLIRWLISGVLFHPRINSAITLCIALVLLFMRGNIFVVLIIIDCIRDIALGTKFYDVSIDFEDVEIDKLYMIKSLISVVTVGYARIVFLLVVNPLICYSVVSDVKNKLNSGYPLPGVGYSSMKAKNYYYDKYIAKLENEGAVVSNIQTVETEIKKSRKKLEGMYPKKLVEKVVDAVAGDKEIKNKRKEAEGKLSNYRFNTYAYLSTSVYEKYPQAISEAMSDKGYVSSCVIIGFDELKPLMLPLRKEQASGSNEWSEYFVIQALQPLVADGTFMDDDFSDNDAFDNHAYAYAHSTKKMPSHSPETNPLLALDDD